MSTAVTSQKVKVSERNVFQEKMFRQPYSTSLLWSANVRPGELKVCLGVLWGVLKV